MIHPSMVILGMIYFFFGLPHYPTLPPHFQTQPIQLPFCFHSLNPQPPGPQGCFTLPQVLQPWMIRVANGCELFRPGNRSATLCPGFYMFLWSYQGEFGHIKIVNYASVIKTRDKHSMMNIIHHYPLWIHCSNSLSWNKADLIYIYMLPLLIIMPVTRQWYRCNLSKYYY